MSLVRKVIASGILGLSFVSTAALAETTGPQYVEELICEYNNTCYVKMHVPEAAVPHCGGNRFVFEAASKSGKNVLALLSMAFLSKSRVNVAYYSCSGSDYSLAYLSVVN